MSQFLDSVVVCASQCSAMLTSVHHLAVVDGLNVTLALSVMNMLMNVAQCALEALSDEVLWADLTRPLHFSRVQTVLQCLI